MQVAGSVSWRFAESARDSLPHVALFVRDALGLAVPPGPAVPPPLAGTVPDRRASLSDEERREAGRHWPGWWAALLGAEVDRQEERPDPDHPALRARYEEAGSPPDFAALADRPALRRAVVDTFPEALRWVDRLLDAGSRAQRAGSFPYALVRQVAEDVAFDRQVDVGAVRASAVVLEVEGRWWHLLAPGAVVCSAGAAADLHTAHLVLRRAFESGLRR